MKKQNKIVKFSQIEYQAVVAERLRRLTRNQIPSWSVGSNPTDCDRIFLGVFTFLICY